MSGVLAVHQGPEVQEPQPVGKINYRMEIDPDGTRRIIVPKGVPQVSLDSETNLLGPDGKPVTPAMAPLKDGTVYIGYTLGSHWVRVPDHEVFFSGFPGGHVDNMWRPIDMLTKKARHNPVAYPYALHKDWKLPPLEVAKLITENKEAILGDMKIPGDGWMWLGYGMGIGNPSDQKYSKVLAYHVESGTTHEVHRDRRSRKLTSIPVRRLVLKQTPEKVKGGLLAKFFGGRTR